MKALNDGMYSELCEGVVKWFLLIQDTHHLCISDRSQCMERKSSKFWYEKRNAGISSDLPR